MAAVVVVVVVVVVVFNVSLRNTAAYLRAESAELGARRGGMRCFDRAVSGGDPRTARGRMNYPCIGLQLGPKGPVGKGRSHLP